MTTTDRAAGAETGVLPSRGGGVPGAPDLDATFRKALPHILSMARRRGFNDDEQREIAQRVGLLLVVRKDAYEPALGTPVEWAIGVAKNIFREARRAARAQRLVFEQVPLAGLDSQPSKDLTPEEGARAHAALGIILTALTEQERKVLELTVEGCTAKDVAEILDLPITTVEFRLKTARARITAVLKRLGEDENSVMNVRGTALPLVTVEDIEHAWRAQVVRRGPQTALDPAPPRAPGFPGRRVPRVGVLRAAKLGAMGSVLYATGVLTGLLLAAPNDPGTDGRASIVAERPPPPDEAVAATSVPAASIAPVAPATVAPTAAPAPSASAVVFDPAVASESMLLQMALGAAPARAYGLANLHAERFPSQNVEKREMVLVRALVGLGRRSEAVRHARMLEGTLYEKQAAEAIGGPLP